MTSKEFMKDIILVLATIVVSMIGFYLIESQNYVKANDVKAIIEDKQAIVVQQVNQLQITSQKLEDALRKTTDALNDLRVELARRNDNR